MELLNISDLIDAGTEVRRSMIAVSLVERRASGYLVFVKDGKLVERQIAFDINNNCRYIVYMRKKYKINMPARPISGAYNVESLGGKRHVTN